MAHFISPTGYGARRVLTTFNGTIDVEGSRVVSGVFLILLQRLFYVVLRLLRVFPHLVGVVFLLRCVLVLPLSIVFLLRCVLVLPL